jgi:peptide/nickel transport system ATP-binding protein
MSALLEVTDLVKTFRLPGGVLEAVSGVSFTLDKGETLALVGESGCGKSTVGRTVLQLYRADGGSVHFAGEDLSRLAGRELRQRRVKLQMILQDPRAALNPRRRVRDLVAEGLAIHGVPRSERKARVDAVLREVGLDPQQVRNRRAKEFSGGQCQRIAIARAMVLNPELVVCDEPVASLDVSVQAQVINLLQAMQAEHGLAMLFISHDLAVVRSMSDRVAVMYLGRIVEIAAADEIYDNPAHPYTSALLDSIPSPDPGAAPLGPPLRGEIPSPMNPPSGCRFRTRCPLAEAVCAEVVPPLRDVGGEHRSACHFAEKHQAAAAAARAAAGLRPAAAQASSTPG